MMRDWLSSDYIFLCRFDKTFLIITKCSRLSALMGLFVQNIIKLMKSLVYKSSFEVYIKSRVLIVSSKKKNILEKY